MARDRSASRTVRLREAASTIFALVTLVPLLLLFYILHRYDALWEPEAQLALALAVLLAILGYTVLQQMLSRFARIASAVATADGAAARRGDAAARVSG